MKSTRNLGISNERKGVESPAVSSRVQPSGAFQPNTTRRDSTFLLFFCIIFLFLNGNFSFHQKRKEMREEEEEEFLGGAGDLIG
jgi:hypothetical protein